MEIDVTDASFEKDVVEKSKEIPVLVDFWAKWCNPCTILKPALKKVVSEFEGKVILAKMNVDDGQKSAQKLGVMSIPVVKLFKDGEVVDGFVGAQPEEKIREWLNSKL